MKRFWDLWEKSVIVRGLVTLMLVATSCYLAIVGQDIPAWLYGFVGLALGSLFAGQAQRAAK